MEKTAIDRVKDREKLSPRREPYWRALGTGKHLGYRRTEEGGHWIARAYDAGTRRREYRAIGDLSHIAPTDQFTAAGKLAREWFEHLGMGGSTEAITVRKACERYVAQVRRKKGDTAADDALGRFTRHVYGDEIAGVELIKLRPLHVGQWRERLEDKPAASAKRGPNCRTKGELPSPRKRSASSLNRDMTAFRAALNLAHLEGFATSNLAWSAKLGAVENAGRRRELYLSRDQRRALLNALPENVRPFVLGLCLLPLRPGALASLTVASFDARHGVLTVGKDKSGADRRVLLPPETAALMREQCRSKLPSAPLFARWDGQPWDKDAWKGPIKRAAIEAELPPGTSAYTLRHSVITDLLLSTADAEGNQVAGVDAFTVAALSGTSIAMVEKHYGHLRGDRAQAALGRLAL